MEFPVLETERLRMTLPGPAAAARVVRYFVDNRAHHAPWSPRRKDEFYTEEFWRTRLAFDRAEFAEDQSMRLFLFDREEEDGAVLGNCTLTQFARGPFQAAILGYALDEDAVGRGLMAEALRTVIAYAFGELRLHRIMANYIPTNERSGLLLRRLGFVVEGYARDYLEIDGAWRDHVLTSLTNAGYSSSRSNT